MAHRDCPMGSGPVERYRQKESKGDQKGSHPEQHSGSNQTLPQVCGHNGHEGEGMEERTPLTSSTFWVIWLFYACSQSVLRFSIWYGLKTPRPILMYRTDEVVGRQFPAVLCHRFNFDISCFIFIFFLSFLCFD